MTTRNRAPHRPPRLARQPLRHIGGLLLLAALPVWAGPLSDADIADALRNPSLGLYKGYAEFKMAHYPQARQVWTALAERGSAEAWFNLGNLAEDGLGEPRDASRAIMLYERGAELGSVKAQYRLGQLYSAGTLVPADRGKAEKWLARAADSGDKDAVVQLAALRAGGSADPYLAAQQLEASGQASQAAAAYRSLSERGHLRARTRLAWLHEAGRGVPRNLDEAARLFRSAAEGGDAEAQYAIAVMLETGAGQPRDMPAALSWLRRSAAAGYGPAQDALRARSGGGDTR